MHQTPLDLNNPAQIIEKYQQLVWHLARAQTAQESDAEDILQEVFMRLIKYRPRFNDEEHLKAWLIKATVNRRKSLYQTAWYRRTVPLKTCTEPFPTEENFLLDILRRMPQKCSTILYLTYYEDLPLEEVAKLLGISYQAAAKRLSRARKALKEHMEGDKL